jgi:hypothetical protein
MLGPRSKWTVRRIVGDARVGADGCDEILLEFQEGSLGGSKYAVDNILHYMQSLKLDLRPKTSCTTYGTLTLT